MTRKRRVIQLAKRYRRLLGLERWDIAIVFDDRMEDRANCAADPEYFEATVKFNLERIEDGDEECYVRHELLHCILWPLCHCADFLARENRVANEMVRLANERVTSCLERMPLWEQLE
jgi:hypothetical protein